ncbi:DUF3738 domain-containing protein [Siphonobacter sp. SORGH_AS_1065]|uniref:DUF3738 domain-containing protein n=1 Tax=Siphonobacter sp. SORGH_AS_1065 TaxID=3041795 RepID=UPI0027D7FB22|nr:DUF3738 domain-containing protein [Siphonobacter sp. SORGH_AS_1065]
MWYRIYLTDNERLPIHAELQLNTVSVYLLVRRKDKTALPSSNKPYSMSYRGRGLQSTGVPVEVLPNYTEITLRRPVWDETDYFNQYDLNLELRLEDKQQSLLEGLQKLGLTLVESKRPIEYLILSSK